MGSDAPSRDASPTVELTSTQAELPKLLEKVFCLVASDAGLNMEAVPEFRSTIRDFCNETARFFDTMILAFTKSKDGPHNYKHPQSGPAGLQTSAAQSAKRKNPSKKDMSYRPSKSAKVKTEEITSMENLDEPRDEMNLDDTCSARDDVSWLLDQQRSILQHDSTNTVDITTASETAVDEGAKEEVQESAAASATNADTERRPISLEQASHTPPSNLTSLDKAPVTPTEQAACTLPSPRTEKIRSDKKSTLDKQSTLVEDGSSPPEVTPWKDMILEAVRIIHRISIHPKGVPRAVYSRILQTLQKSHEGTADTPKSSQWSDGFMWIRVLECGSAENQKITIFNMLEYMGAWEWYDSQVKLSQLTVRTKKKKLVGRKGAATHVLNQVQKGMGQQGKCLSGIGRLTLTTEADDSNGLAESYSTSITEQVRQIQRKNITLQLSRGQKLCTKLVKELGLGILLNKEIWAYTKKDAEEIDVLIQQIKTDSKRVRLLQILGQQIEDLVNKGQPDLHSLYESLEDENLVSEEEMGELRNTFALEADKLPDGTLGVAIDRLIEDTSTKVLSKRKLTDEDSIILKNGVELSHDMFNQLRQGKWFDDLTIKMAMEISDRPFYVKYGHSIPLHEAGRNNARKSIRKPFAGWARNIVASHNEARGNDVGLVYLCPLNHNNDHFTLLEINERDKKIRHYNSMAEEGVIDGTLKLTRVGKLVQEQFGHLEYEYSEAPTPQQDDGWSCGVRVVWAAGRISNDLPFEDWHVKLNPERMKMEIVEGLRALIEDSVWEAV